MQAVARTRLSSLTGLVAVAVLVSLAPASAARPAVPASSDPVCVTVRTATVCRLEDGATHVVDAVGMRVLLPESFPATAEPVSVELLRPVVPVVTVPDPAPVWDLLVVVTSQVRLWLGGSPDAVAAFAGVLETITNTALATSDIPSRVRVVGIHESPYVESGQCQVDLERVYTPADGYFDEVLPLREMLGADLVHVITRCSNYCGIAYQMGFPHPFYASMAFSVTNMACTNGNYSGPHEIGHNAGAHHLPGQGCPGAYPYACGYFSAACSYCDVMSSCGGSRRLVWSSPRVTLSGCAAGTETQDNAMAVINTGTIVANYRPAADTGLLPLPSAVRVHQ